MVGAAGCKWGRLTFSRPHKRPIQNRPSSLEIADGIADGILVAGAVLLKVIVGIAGVADGEGGDQIDAVALHCGALKGNAHGHVSGEVHALTDEGRSKEPGDELDVQLGVLKLLHGVLAAAHRGDELHVQLGAAGIGVQRVHQTVNDLVIVGNDQIQGLDLFVGVGVEPVLHLLLGLLGGPVGHEGLVDLVELGGVDDLVHTAGALGGNGGAVAHEAQVVDLVVISIVLVEVVAHLFADADAIFASFLQVYGINLRAMRGKMHWLDFAAAMKGLFQGPKCPLSELVYIRSCPIPKPNRTNQEQIRALMKAKAKCRLKLSEEEERQQYQKGLQKMAANLMGGGVRHG